MTTTSYPTASIQVRLWSDFRILWTTIGTAIEGVTDGIQSYYSVDIDTALRMSVSICKHTRHYICTPMLPYVDIFFYICTYICILQLLIVFWVTYILCDYSFITSFLSISCLCNCVCSYVYICVYIYVSPTHTAHVHTSMYTCAQFLTQPQAFINTHSFISMLIVYLFVCHAML